MFSIEGKFFKALTKAGDFLILGFLGFVFSIPVITMGASITAMFYVGMKLVRDEEGYVFKGFIKSFKQNFKQGFLIELIIGVVAALLIADIRICYMWAKADGGVPIRLLMFAAIGLLLVLSAVALYAFPMLSKFENTVIGILKSTFALYASFATDTYNAFYNIWSYSIFNQLLYGIYSDNTSDSLYRQLCPVKNFSYLC